MKSQLAICIVLGLTLAIASAARTSQQQQEARQNILISGENQPRVCTDPRPLPPNITPDTVVCQAFSTQCICKADNTCTEEIVQCYEDPCSDPNVAAVFDGECPVESEEPVEEVVEVEAEEPVENDPFAIETFTCSSAKRACYDEWHRGCQCDTNGNCGVTWVNECESCQNPQVFSVRAGDSCPGQEEPESPTCFIIPRGAAIGCSPESGSGCKCFTNGTCNFEENLNYCVDCQTVGVESVAIGETCEGEKLNYFMPEVCPDLDPAVTSCVTDRATGCACYANGTCATIESNQCIACTTNDIVSFNAGETCPEIEGPVYVCPTDEDEEVAWEGQAYGCLCYDDGTCHRRGINKNTECNNNDGLVYFVEQSKCIIVDTLPTTPTEEEPEEPTEPETNFFIPDQCTFPKSDPAATLCTQQLEPGCACYKNGTCEYLPNANRCTACLEADILSYNKGEQCPELEDNTKLFTCYPRDGPVACPQYIIEGCTCYQNGTCTEGGVNACSDCGREDIVSVLEGGSCAVTQTLSQQEEVTQEESVEEPQQAGDFFIPNQCAYPKSDPAVTSCLRGEESGCACYEDGTCQYVSNTNGCLACLETEVRSFNQDEQCPEVDGGRFYVCKAEVTPNPFAPSSNLRSQPIACPEYAAEGCLCFNNGTCTEGVVNQCIDCQRDGVVSVTEGGSCPRVESEEEEEAVVEEEVQIESSLHTCTPQDRFFNNACNRSMRVGCVCYFDGSCKQDIANPCTVCKNPFVVSVAPGEKCKKRHHAEPINLLFKGLGHFRASYVAFFRSMTVRTYRVSHTTMNGTHAC